jgi:hypothetical protein
MYIYIKERKEKERGREKVLLRNQTTIAQVIAKPGAWLLNHLLELEKAAYAIFFCSTNVKKKKPFFFFIINQMLIQGHQISLSYNFY